MLVMGYKFTALFQLEYQDDCNKNVVFTGGNTNTGRAITFSLYNALSLSSGARPFVRKTALILTDGRSQDDVGNPAREMRNAGMRVRTCIVL